VRDRLSFGVFLDDPGKRAASFSEFVPSLSVTANQFSAPTEPVGATRDAPAEALAAPAGEQLSPFRKFLADYKSTLKAVEAEELLDLIVYRPLAFVVTRLCYRTPITPNQISVASLGFGLLAGYLFWVGSPVAGLLAAASYFTCNVLDCADGQLARMRGTSSPFGFAVDGSIDYLASAAVFVGMAHHLVVQRPGEYNWWWVATAAGLLYAWQCAILDRKRHDWLHRVHGRRRDTSEEIAWMKEHLERYRKERSHAFERLLIWIYLAYMGVWTRLAAGKQKHDQALPPQKLWAECQRPVLRMALWMGPTTQMSLIMLAGLTNRVDWFLWGSLVLGNGYAILVLLVQWRANEKLKRLLAAS